MKHQKLTKILALLLAVVMAAGLMAGCGDSGKVDPEDQTVIRLLLNFDAKEEIESILPIFEKAHPEIRVEIMDSDSGVGETPTALSKLSAAGDLPDVAFGVENFAYILSQGLAYPLDNLYANDPDKENALQAGVNNYTYNGHLYALPWRVQFNTIQVNVDLFDTLNLDDPGYEWTVEEFMDLCKKATTSQYSGINYVYGGDNTHELATKLMGGLLEDPLQMYGYNFETNQFNFTNGAWAKSQALVEELRAVPGLVSDELKEPSKRNQGIADAYDLKFGGSADALVQGKVLFGNHNSWQTSWMHKGFNFEWDLYPVPTAEGLDQRIQTHVDYVFIVSSCPEEKAQAAYELVKFLSYDEEACKGRIDYCKANLETYLVYTPSSADPEVLKYYAQSGYAPEGLVWCLETISEDPEKIFIADANKLIPNFWNDVTTYLDQVESQIKKGSDPYSLAADFEKKCNIAAGDTWANFQKKLTKYLDEFYASHPGEKK